LTEPQLGGGRKHRQARGEPREKGCPKRGNRDKKTEKEIWQEMRKRNRNKKKIEKKRREKRTTEKGGAVSPRSRLMVGIGSRLAKSRNERVYAGFSGMGRSSGRKTQGETRGKKKEG